MNEDYLLLKVGVPRQHAELVESAMLDCGALSCAYQDATDTPIHEPAPGTTPLWPDVIVTGVYAQTTDADIAKHLLKTKISPFTESEIAAEALQDTDWERAWMDDFKPVQVGNQLWVVPTFCEAPDPTAVNISLDPGLAFGSGTHPTTHLCLQWLARLDLKEKLVVDYGCGSGILAVAAAMLGARQVFAYDIDAQAFQATRENADRNQVAEKVIICHSDKDIPSEVDVVVANILLAPLLELHSRFYMLLKAEGKLGVSGILSEQIATLASAYVTQFRHSETEIREQWAMYTAVKQEVLST